jgi:hypothetical protein
MEMLGIGVNPSGNKDGGIAQQMNDDKQNHKLAGNSHQDLSAHCARKYLHNDVPLLCDILTMCC